MIFKEMIYVRNETDTCFLLWGGYPSMGWLSYYGVAILLWGGYPIMGWLLRTLKYHVSFRTFHYNMGLLR